MAIINFPNSPSINDVFTANGRSWKWDGSFWLAIPLAGPTGVTGPTGATGATGAGVTGATGAGSTVTAAASVLLSTGALVNLFDNAGTINARYADNSAEGKEAWGYVNSLVVTGATATVYGGGEMIGLTGLSTGTKYCLGSSGALTATAPTTAGTVVQWIGIATSSSTLFYAPWSPLITN